jgi:DNA primase
VRLAHAGETLVLAEGIETALTILEATSIPVWATLGTSGLRGIIVPQTVRTIVLAVDNDQAGIEAARDATARFIKEGRTVKQVLPPENCKDFNDYKQREKQC